MIEVRNLQFEYPGREFTLRVPSFDFPFGSTAAITGPSGIGKTTFLLLLAGYLVPGEGKVTINATQLSEMNDRERRAFRIRHIGMVFQEFELIEYLSALDNMLLPFRITPELELTREVVERARDLSGAFGITGLMHRNVRRLSQGERQRVALCRALLTKPGLLLCDEPTGNLDPVNKERTLDLLMETVQQSKTTLVVVTHDHLHLTRFERVVDFPEISQPLTAHKEEGGDRP